MSKKFNLKDEKLGAFRPGITPFQQWNENYSQKWKLGDTNVYV